LADVAEVAGVSIMTVSRVANRGSGVGAATRERVLQIMTDLGYQQNPTARALRTGRSSTLGIIFAPPTSPRSSALLRSVEVAAADAGYDVTLATLRSLDERALGEAVGRLQSARVAAILVLAPQMIAAQAVQDIAPDVPLVMEWGSVGLGRPTVVVDQRKAAFEATNHLLELGHDSVVHLAGSPQWNVSHWRAQGWSEALEQAGRMRQSPIAGDWSPGSGYTAGLELLAKPGVTAVLAASDAMAVGLLAAARELGRAVPSDLSVVGFDDDPTSAFLDPPLTTVRIDLESLGSAMVNLALDQVSGVGGAEDHAAVDLSLIVRRSTAPPPGRG
jgi:DNA-binding LacI/PurR family transcriptional regulator